MDAARAEAAREESLIDNLSDRQLKKDESAVGWKKGRGREEPDNETEKEKLFLTALTVKAFSAWWTTSTSLE